MTLFLGNQSHQPSTCAQFFKNVFICLLVFPAFFLQTGVEPHLSSPNPLDYTFKKNQISHSKLESTKLAHSHEDKTATVQCLVWPVMLYGCETWTRKKEGNKCIEEAEMWLYRRLLVIHVCSLSWTANNHSLKVKDII